MLPTVQHYREVKFMLTLDIKFWKINNIMEIRPWFYEIFFTDRKTESQTDTLGIS